MTARIDNRQRILKLAEEAYLYDVERDSDPIGWGWRSVFHFGSQANWPTIKSLIAEGLLEQDANEVRFVPQTTSPEAN